MKPSHTDNTRYWGIPRQFPKTPKFSPQAVVLSTPASRQGLEYLFSPLAQASDPLKSPLRTELGWHQKGQWGLSQPGRAPMDNRHKTLKGSGVVKLGFERIGQDMTEIVNRPDGGLARTFLPQRYPLAQVSTTVLNHRHRSTGRGENLPQRLRHGLAIGAFADTHTKTFTVFQGDRRATVGQRIHRHP